MPYLVFFLRTMDLETMSVAETSAECPMAHLPWGISLQASPYRHLPAGISLQASPRRHLPTGMSVQASPYRHVPTGMSVQACPCRHVWSYVADFSSFVCWLTSNSCAAASMQPSTASPRDWPFFLPGACRAVRRGLGRIGHRTVSVRCGLQDRHPRHSPSRHRRTLREFCGKK